MKVYSYTDVTCWKKLSISVGDNTHAKRFSRVATIAAIAVASAVAWSKQNKKEIVGVRPEEVKWFTPPYSTLRS